MQGELVMELNLEETKMTFQCLDSDALIPDKLEERMVVVAMLVVFCVRWGVGCQTSSDWTMSLIISIVLIASVVAFLKLTLRQLLWQWRSVRLLG